MVLKDIHSLHLLIRMVARRERGNTFNLHSATKNKNTQGFGLSLVRGLGQLSALTLRLAQISLFSDLLKLETGQPEIEPILTETIFE